MKIVSYNINGLNAFVKNYKMHDLLKTIPADVYCFQEVKTDWDKLIRIVNTTPELNDYTFVLNNSKGKNGYAGVAFMFKTSFYNENVICTDNIEFSYNGDITYTSGRIVEAEFKDFILINVYVVNSGNKDEIRKDFDIQFRNYLRSLKKPYIVCGDFNVCATELDYWGNYTKQINSGPGLMEYEIDGMKTLIEKNQLIDVYRELNPDKRAYTWYSPKYGAIYKGWGWRIDYFLASKKLISYINNSNIYEKFQGADHCPIELEIYEDMKK